MKLTTCFVFDGLVTSVIGDEVVAVMVEVAMVDAMLVSEGVVEREVLVELVGVVSERDVEAQVTGVLMEVVLEGIPDAPSSTKTFRTRFLSLCLCLFASQ